MKSKGDNPPINDNLTPSIFFTPLLLIFTGILLFVALLYGEKDLAVFALLLLVLYAGLKLWSMLSAREINCRFLVDRERLFPDETVHLKIRIENNKLLPVFVKIGLSTSAFLQAESGNAGIHEEGGLLWYQGVTFHREFLAQKRGIYLLKTSSFSTGDLFGIFLREKREDQGLTVIVYPRLIPIRPFPLLKKIVFGKSGVTSPVRDPAYILGTRDYLHFSPARHIHWKASARHNRLQEKIFEPAEQDKVILILDGEGFYENGAYNEFERALEAIASLTEALESRHYATAFLTNCHRQGEKIFRASVVRNSGRLPDLFELLAGLQIKSSEKMADLLAKGGGAAGRCRLRLFFLFLLFWQNLLSAEANTDRAYRLRRPFRRDDTGHGFRRPKAASILSGIFVLRVET